jgi:adenosylcobinamide-GDP ribazoletransferase
LNALLAFFTVLPVRGATLEEAAREIRLLPLIGLITGLPGAALLLAAHFVPPGVASTLALGAVLLAAGLHHADGVLDVGDAIMAHGSPNRRREVLEDTRVGVGGLGALFLVYAPTVGALAALCATSPAHAALALLAGEVAARSAMLLTLAFGEPADPRSSSVPFVRALSGPQRTPAVVVAVLAPLPFLLATSASLAPLAILAVPLVTLGALRISAAKFEGISGDVVGATGEVSRAALLVFLSATV